MGTIWNVQHPIDLDPQEEKSLNWSPYRADQVESQLQKSEIDKMLRIGVIERTHTEMESTIVLVPKKGRTLRF